MTMVTMGIVVIAIAFIALGFRKKPGGTRNEMQWSRITSYNVCYTKLLRVCLQITSGSGELTLLEAALGSTGEIRTFPAD